MRAFAAVVCVAGVAAVVASAALPAVRPSLAVAPNPVRAGHMVVLKGSAGSCPVGDTVTLISHAFSGAHMFAGVPAAVTRVRGGHVFRTTAVVPKSRYGSYAITGRCGGGNLGFLVRLRVAR